MLLSASYVFWLHMPHFRASQPTQNFWHVSRLPLAGVFIPTLLDELRPARGRLRASLTLKVRTT